MAAAAGESTIAVHTWMQWFLGVSEKELLASMREQVFADGAFVHAATGRRWPAGSFERVSVNELGRSVAELPAREPDPAARVGAALKVVDGIDIGRLQATLRTEDRAMVQIASNFNCLENPSRSCEPDYGHLVEGYASDTTQGPAASFGVPAASLLRAHYAFHDLGTPPSEWGQSADRQVDLLGGVRRFFGTCVNGKATLSGTEDPLGPGEIDAVAQEIQVGVHVDAPVVFGRCGAVLLQVLQEPFPVVDQVLSASMNWGSPGVRPQQEQLNSLTRAALRAAYEGAYLAAIRRGRRLLLLTLVGGGSFRNPEQMILEELARAHARWAAHPASELEEVRLCLYPRGEAPRVESALGRLLLANGSGPATGCAAA